MEMNMGRVWCVAPIVVAVVVFSCGGHAQSSGTTEGRGGSSGEIDKLLKVCDTHLAANRLTDSNDLGRGRRDSRCLLWRGAVVGSDEP